MTLATPLFEKKFYKGLFLDCPLEYACQIWSPVSLTKLEQLVFSAQKIRGSRHPGYAPFRKNKWSFLDCP